MGAAKPTILNIEISGLSCPPPPIVYPPKLHFAAMTKANNVINRLTSFKSYARVYPHPSPGPPKDPRQYSDFRRRYDARVYSHP